MNILVTGGAGFIGTHITKILLESGHDVTVLDNLSKSKKENVDPKANLIIGDITDPKAVENALEGIDEVIHLAGLIVVPESVKDPILYCQNNVIGTINLLEVMKKKNIKKIIFSSSACVYGTPSQLPITEEAPIQPDNPYGASKASVESFLQSYNANFGFDVVILRYFNPYGPGENHDPETHAIPNFIKSTLAKKPIPLYWKGEQVRDFIYIEDLARAHTDVLNSKGFKIYNVGSETGVKIKDVLEKIFKIAGYTVPIDDLGKRAGDVEKNFASSKKIEKEVGWKAKTNLEQGLKNTIDYFKSSTP